MPRILQLVFLFFSFFIISVIFQPQDAVGHTVFCLWSPCQVVFFIFFPFMAIYHDEIEIEDMEYDEDCETYFYPCPCGDRFQITKVELQAER